MISPEEIKQQVLKWWKPFLQSRVSCEPFFPKQIERIGTVKPAQILHKFEATQNEIEALYNASKNNTGSGYLIKTSGKTFRRTGSHDLPSSIEFETISDFVSFSGKKKEWKTFEANLNLLLQELPQLKGWILDNVQYLTIESTCWTDIIKVCNYFILTPRPNLYLRQLPIEIHTKFIENNASLLQSLLNFLIPEHIRSSDQKRFSERYFLKHDEPLVRIRILDTNHSIHSLLDVSIKLSDFEAININCKNVLITENKMNFLTLPDLSSTIAIWSGGGFNVGYLKNTTWLRDKNIFYWGDIDEHGFQILHQLRSYFRHVKSIMMDRLTFDTFQEFAVVGERNKAENLFLLNEAEISLYAFLKAIEKNRLEQEKLSQLYIDLEFKKILG
jgi:hypothetical protein